MASEKSSLDDSYSEEEAGQAPQGGPSAGRTRSALRDSSPIAGPVEAAYGCAGTGRTP
jgi:hypothetical protein